MIPERLCSLVSKSFYLFCWLDGFASPSSPFENYLPPAVGRGHEVGPFLFFPRVQFRSTFCLLEWKAPPSLLDGSTILFILSAPVSRYEVGGVHGSGESSFASNDANQIAS